MSSGQINDIVQESAKKMSKIMAHHSGDSLRQLLAWRVRANVLEIQKKHKKSDVKLRHSRFNYSIFLSQSYDDDWTMPVRTAAVEYLEANGINPVIASKEVVSGPSIIAKVLAMIQSSEGLLCVLTPSKSDPQLPSSWQITEIALGVACGKPIGFLVEDSVKEWAKNYYGSLYNLITCSSGEHLIQVLDDKIEETMMALEQEICSRHIEDISLTIGR